MGNGQLCSSSHSFWLKISLIRPCGTKHFYSTDKKFRGQCRKGEDVGFLYMFFVYLNLGVRSNCNRP